MNISFDIAISAGITFRSWILAKLARLEIEAPTLLIYCNSEKVTARCTYNDSVAIILSDSPNNPSEFSSWVIGERHGDGIWKHKQYILSIHNEWQWDFLTNKCNRRAWLNSKTLRTFLDSLNLIKWTQCLNTIKLRWFNKKTKTFVGVHFESETQIIRFSFPKAFQTLKEPLYSSALGKS